MFWTVVIPSISCGNCARHIDKAARSIAGVENVQVDIATKRVEISGSFDQQALVAKLVEDGYPPE
jgi:copper chaperone CopZ